LFLLWGISSSLFLGFRHLYVTDAKMLIGRRLPLQNDIQHWPFKVIESPRDKPLTVINYKGEEKQFTAEELNIFNGPLKDASNCQGLAWHHCEAWGTHYPCPVQ